MSKYRSCFGILAEEYAQYCRARGTWNGSYETNLITFDHYCAAAFPESNSIEQDMIDIWCAKRETEKVNSCRSRIYSVRNFVAWLNARKGYHLSIPDVPAEQHRNYVPHPFTEDELDAFFAACDLLPIARCLSETAMRERQMIASTLFRLLYSSGIRTTEARLLRCDDVDLASGVLNIRHSKGPDEHYVVLHESMRTLALRYDTAMSTLLPARQYFFPKGVDDFHTAQWLTDLFNGIAKRAGIHGAVPYDLRHNYATTNINSWVGEGMSSYSKLVYLSKSMGHRSVESTKYYYSLVPAFADTLSKLSDDGVVPLLEENNEDF